MSLRLKVNFYWLLRIVDAYITCNWVVLLTLWSFYPRVKWSPLPTGQENLSGPRNWSGRGEKQKDSAPAANRIPVT